MYQTYIGEKNALVFPVMCDGYLSVEFRQGETGTATALLADGSQRIKQPQTYGIWDVDSFTIETVLTPYDMNGHGYYLYSGETLGNFGIDSNYLTKKSLPQVKTNLGTTTTYDNQSQSNSYLSKAHRLASSSTANDGYKMTIFWNENVELYLQNTSITSHNQPAEYQICFSIKSDNTTHVVRSGTIITANSFHSGKSIESSIINQKYSGKSDLIEYDRISKTVNAISEGATVLTLTDTGVREADYLYPGQKLYTLSGQIFTYFSTVEGVSGSGTGATVTIAAAAHAISSPTTLYQITKQEAPYLLNSYHIAASFNKDTGVMAVYIDGALLASSIHIGDFSKFLMYADDCKIGQGSTSYSTAVTIDSGTRTNILYSQFFGELHEFAIINRAKSEFETTQTLVPNNRDLLLYYRFEEVDL